MKNELIGIWRIDSMELWSQKFVDLVTEGNFTFEEDEYGHFAFGAVRGELRYGIEQNEEKIHFSWEGLDERDRRSGRGWVHIDGRKMKGKFYFHDGDDSGFTAYKK
ncbi:hypothetical protein DDZ13_13055 [Coraliomargarita sinensis]|uniref:Uncharacterized protein n=1 Tax=Coraliomargarita sinensis TaxID=2174842 RepID=A0A317ZDI0_9BACT|nr:hypothetical protein [Coraliomargarita sinensis]PXA03345.1 hypothetical protein DDZ13_13055 [Coraliomargarita sinensis]